MNTAKTKILRDVFFYVVTFCCLSTIAVICYLTMQSGHETLSTQALVVSLFPKAFPENYDSRLWMSLGLNGARKLAHIYEFGALSFFSTLMILFAPSTKDEIKFDKSRSVIKSFILSVSFCFICSFTDQVHKIFVMYRHFDVADLRLDAIGYVLAAFITCSVYCIVRFLLSKPSPSSVFQTKVLSSNMI